MRVEIATKKKLWTAVIHKLPKQWFHMMLKWSQRTNLRVFINGVFALQAGSQKREILSNADRKNDEVWIAKQDSSVQKKTPIQMDMTYLAIWYELLGDADVVQAYERSVYSNTKSKACCYKKQSKSPEIVLLFPTVPLRLLFSCYVFLVMSYTQLFQYKKH